MSSQPGAKDGAVRKKVTIATLAQMRAANDKITMLTAYDASFASLMDQAGVDTLLVGDSLGMVVQGHPDTTSVTMDDMVHHLRAVARARSHALVGADLPYKAYETPAQAVRNARRLVEAGAEYVKAEGGREILPQIRAILAEGIPFMGHLGMLPQHVVEEGGKYRIKGRDEVGRQRLLEDAIALEEAGAFASVLELVTPPVAAEIRGSCSRMLTLGIGSGPDCDGQILVTHDLIGAFPWFTPKFVAPRLRTGESIRRVAQEWLASLAIRS